MSGDLPSGLAHFFINFIKFQVGKLSGTENAQTIFAQIDSWIDQEQTKNGLTIAIAEAYSSLREDSDVVPFVKQIFAPSQLPLLEADVYQALQDLPRSSTDDGVIDAILNSLHKSLPSLDMGEEELRYAIWKYIQY